MKIPFEQAVERHGTTVLRVCRAILGPGTDADDAWSETFLAAMKAWPELDDSTNVEAWLVRVSHHKAVDITRQQARRARVNSSVPPEELTHYEGEGASVSNGEASLVDCDLWALVEALPIRQREAIAYHFLGGLSHAETAALTGSNADAVRRAAADGMKKLRKIYDDE